MNLLTRSTKVTLTCAPIVALAVAIAGTPTASAVETSFSAGTKDTWPVPADTSSAGFQLVGGSGGSAVASGGSGGATVATLDLTPGTLFDIQAATSGDDFGVAGVPGGGSGGSLSGGGGGASVVSVGAPTTPANVLLVAGGGGGAGFSGNSLPRGGNGGGTVGGAGGSDHGCEASAAGGNQDGSTGSGLYLTGSPGSGSGGGGGGGWFGGSGASCAGGGGGGSGYIHSSARNAFFLGSGGAPPVIYIRYYPLSVSVTGPGTVTATGISCGAGQSDCIENFARDDQVTFTATPAVGAAFEGFAGCEFFQGECQAIPSCTGDTCQVTVSPFDTQISAIFSEAPTCKGKPVTISATEGVPTLGTDGKDVIAGTTGNDRIKAGDGKDLVCGLDAKDTIKGGADNDVLLGGKGQDALDGGSGRDSCPDASRRETVRSC